MPAPDLSLALSGASVGEIWIRSGYCYNQNYYNSYDRPATVAVTIWYAYGQQSVTYRYTLSDAFLPTTSSADWSNGYQRLLLPEEYTGVTQIDLTIETVYAGRGNAGVAISDIALAADVHATATPRAYTTATPKPYIAYVTPRPSTTPTSTVELITPVPTGATEPPTPTAEPVFPSTGRCGSAEEAGGDPLRSQQPLRRARLVLQRGRYRQRHQQGVGQRERHLVVSD